MTRPGPAAGTGGASTVRPAIATRLLPAGRGTCGVWTCVSFGSRTGSPWGRRRASPSGRKRGRVTLTRGVGAATRPRSDESANAGLAIVAALPPDVPEELVARPERHRDRAGEQHQGDVIEHVPDRLPRLAGDLAQREAEAAEGDRLEDGLHLAGPGGGDHDLLEDR